MRPTLPVVLFATLAAIGSAQRPAAFDATWRRVAADLLTELKESGIVGGSFWFLHGEEVLAREFHGFADLETQRRVDENTIFHWASITKTLTGIAAMQLRDRMRLRLDEKIVDRIPELKKVHGGEWDVGAVTLRHLLSHSSGFRENIRPLRWL